MIDLTQADVAQGLEEKVTYTWRVSALSCKKSKTNKNLRLVGEATVVEGPALGTTAAFPFLGIYDSVGGRTGSWIAKTKVFLGKLLSGIENVKDLPSAAGEVTPTMEELMTVVFQATARFIPEKEDENTGVTYDAKWELGRVLGPVDAADVADVDWSSYFD